jgi:uncharacterized secreted protein with C-terminal beta-propeller domain
MFKRILAIIAAMLFVGLIIVSCAKKPDNNSDTTGVDTKVTTNTESRTTVETTTETTVETILATTEKSTTAVTETTTESETVETSIEETVETTTEEVVTTEETTVEKVLIVAYFRDMDGNDIHSPWMAWVEKGSIYTIPVPHVPGYRYYEGKMTGKAIFKEKIIIVYKEET